MCQALPGTEFTAENRMCEMEWALGETEGGGGSRGRLVIQR